MTPWRIVSALGTALALTLALLVLAGSTPSNVDDGFIVLVYARHFASTGRIFWNAGEGSIDGFTSFLDMALKAASVKLAPADLVRNAHVIAIGSYLASVAAGALTTYRAFAVRADEEPPGVPLSPPLPAPPSPRLELVLATIVATTFAFDFALAQATSFLLEGPLFAFLALASAGVLLFASPDRMRTRVVLVVLWSLLALARPEGIPLALAQAAWFTWLIARAMPRRERFAPGAALLVVLSAYTLWHRFYFEAWAPNTFYAKSSDSRLQEIADGIAYVQAHAATSMTTALLVASIFFSPLLAVSGRLWSSNEARLRFSCVAGLACIAGLEVVVEGGDSYPGGRFLAVPIALALLAIALAAAGLRGRARLGPIALAALVVVTGLARGTPHLSERTRRIASWPIHETDYACEIEVAAKLAARATSVAQTDFQRLKFYRDDLRVVDLMGLNDRARAHAASPGKNLWGKGGPAAGPASGADVLQLGILAIQRAPMARFTSAQIASDERLATAFIGYPIPSEATDALAADYVTASIPVCGAFFNFFVRKDLAARFADVAIMP